MSDEIITIKKKTTYALTAQGEILGFTLGGAWRFRKSDIDTRIMEKENTKGAD